MSAVTKKQKTVEQVIIKDNKTRVAVVAKLSSAMTIKVTIADSTIHPKYHKRYSKTSSFLVHNPGIDVAVGDVVVISETKPISKHKSWVVVKKVSE